MKGNKKLIVGLAVGAIAFGAVFAMAATLSVGSAGLGAGTADVASCDDAVDHAYTTAYSSTLPGYRVSAVDVTGIAAACDGNDIKATLLDGSGAALDELTGTVGATGTHSFTVGGDIDAGDVEDIAVVISE